MTRPGLSKMDLSRRGLIPLPGIEVPSGLRCVELFIPDDDAALRQLFGQLVQLTYWRTYERDAEHQGIAWAKAWLAAIAASAGGMECEGMTIDFRQDECGLYFTLDNWATETLIYDGLECLSSDGARDIIVDFAGDLIDQLITDGVLAEKGSPPPLGEAPAFEECKTLHVALSANEIWVVPFSVNSGWTVSVSNYTGAWGDGTTIWACPDGSRYLLGECYSYLKSMQGSDPMPAKPHMQVIGKVGGVYFDPLSLYTVGGSGAQYDLSFQANDSNLTDNLGTIEFDVTICNNLTQWFHDFDFTTLDAHGWANIPGQGTTLAPFSCGNGWGASQNFGIQFQLPNPLPTAYLTWISYDAACYKNSTMNIQESGSGCIGGPSGFSYNDGDFTPPWCLTAGNYLKLTRVNIAGVLVQHLYFWGTGEDPFAGF